MDIHKKFSSCWQRVADSCCSKKTKPNEPEPKKKDAGLSIEPVDSPVRTEPTPAISRPLPPTPAAAPPLQRYIALFDYSARTEEDLSFNTGDILEALDKSQGEWWIARALTGVSASREGYIPANYVAPVESIDAEP